jgi:hypothetical protein
MIDHVAARTYRITVKGELSDAAGRAFEGMTFRHEAGNTVLAGAVADQAQLHHLLRRTADLGLTLLSATVVERDAASGETS